jgi:hypothetical protein
VIIIFLAIKLENGVVILKIQETKKRNTNSTQHKSKKSKKKTPAKKENSVLKDLDELLKINFEKEK